MSAITILVKSPHNFLVWSIIPFLLIHSLIPHKEVRFLLPLVNLVPLIIVQGLQHLPFETIMLPCKRWTKPLMMLILVLFFMLNLVGLAAFSLKPAGNGKMKISKYIAVEFHDKPIRLIHCSWSSPYNPFESVPTKFYQRSNVEEIRILSLCQLNDSLLSDSAENLLVLRQIELKNKRCTDSFAQVASKEITRSIPHLISNLQRFYSETEVDNVLILYSVKHK